jgi:hypothetical protein
MRAKLLLARLAVVIGLGLFQQLPQRRERRLGAVFGGRDPVQRCPALCCAGDLVLDRRQFVRNPSASPASRASRRSMTRLTAWMRSRFAISRPRRRPLTGDPIGSPCFCGLFVVVAVQRLDAVEPSRAPPNWAIKAVRASAACSSDTFRSRSLRPGCAAMEPSSYA